MNMSPSISELERAPEGLAKTRGIVSHHGQAAASFWPVEREGGNDGVPSDLKGSFKARDIRRSVTFLGEKVECRPIMPDVVSFLRLPNCSVRDNPMNLCSTAPKASFGGLKGGLG